MRLIRYKPRTFNNFDRLLFNPFEHHMPFEREQIAIPIDVIEETDSIIVIADLPGFDKDDITIEANHEYIEINASLTSEIEKEDSEPTDEKEVKENYIRRERFTKNVSRKVSFSKAINASEATVAFEDGVLTITLPKAEEAKTITLQI